MKVFQVLWACVIVVMLSSESASGQSCWNCVPDPLNPPCLICAWGGSSGGENCGQQSCTSCDLGSSCGIGGHGCFLMGTLVDTPEGARPIETIDVGDKVISLRDDGTLGYSVVLEAYRVIQSTYYLINGSLRVTATHPFRVSDTWVNAEDLSVGDVLQGRDGRAVVVDAIAQVSSLRRAYNIEVDGAHNFFAQGLLVHNKNYEP